MLTILSLYRRVLPAPATVEVIARAEEELGFRLPELLARLYCEVANGGFGPGFGLIGLSGGHFPNGQSIVQIYREARAYVAPDWNWPDGRLPICDWGCAILTCVDCKSENYQIVFSEEGRFTRLPCSLFEWMQVWCSGGSCMGSIRANVRLRGNYDHKSFYEETGNPKEASSPSYQQEAGKLGL